MRWAALESPLRLSSNSQYKGYVPRAAAHGDEQNVDLTPAKVSFGAVQAQTQFARGW